MVSRLILIPTEGERRVIAPLVAGRLGPADRLDLCGFGPIAAAARTAQLVAALRPVEVLLAGIAGGFDDRAAVGTAWLFERVASFGIGAGGGPGFRSAAQLGWPQWPGDARDASPAVGDELVVHAEAEANVPLAPLLLTACAAADGPEDRAQRRSFRPDAFAEDMEGFGVALACRLQGVSCRLIRGISNIAGDRDQARWRTRDALEAVASLLDRLLATTS